MTKIANLFTDPVWVFSSVVLAAVINIISSYLKVGLDEAVKRLSKTARTKGEHREREITRMVEALKAAPNDRAHFYFMQLKAAIRGCIHGIIGTVVLGLACSIAFGGIAGTRWLEIAAGVLLAGVSAQMLLMPAGKDAYLYNFLEEVLTRSMRGSPVWQNPSSIGQPQTVGTAPTSSVQSNVGASKLPS